MADVAAVIAGITGFPRRPELFARLGLPVESEA